MYRGVNREADGTMLDNLPMHILPRPPYADMPVGLDYDGLKEATRGALRWALSRRGSEPIPPSLVRSAPPGELMVPTLYEADPARALDGGWDETEKRALKEAARLAVSVLMRARGDQAFFLWEAARPPTHLRPYPHKRLTVVMAALRGRDYKEVADKVIDYYEQAKESIQTAEEGLAGGGTPQSELQQLVLAMGELPVKDKAAKLTPMWLHAREEYNPAAVMTSVGLAYFQTTEQGPLVEALQVLSLEDACGVLHRAVDLVASLEASLNDWSDLEEV